jgi:general secretion pathway protein H
MSAAGKPAGFTLIEMLVVLAVTALVTGIAFPALDRTMRGQSFEGAADAIELGLRSARADAISRGVPIRFELGADRRSVLVGGGVIPIPSGTVVTLPTQGIAFFSDGTSNGGRIDLVGSGRSRRLDVDPGSGAVEEVR